MTMTITQRFTLMGVARVALAILATGLGTATLGTAPVAAAQPWGFEQVSPPAKRGTISGVDTFQTSPDGDAFLYTADGSLDGAPAESVPKYTRYLGVRGANAWRNRGVDPPTGPIGSFGDAAIQQVAGTSHNLAHALVVSTLALTPGATDGGGNLYMRDMRSGALTLVATSSSTDLVWQFARSTGQTAVKFVAPDGRSALIASQMALLPGVPDYALYSWTADGGLRVESVLPASEGGAPIAITSAGGANSDSGIRDGLPFVDGLTHIYYSAWGGSNAAYVRTGDAVRAVSVSHIPGDPATPVPAVVDAISEGGRYMVFHTTGNTPLTTTTPSGLSSDAWFTYRYDVVTDTLDYVATNAGGGMALQMTQDGQTIIVQGSLALDGHGVTGQRNTYVWRGGSLRYVATADAWVGGKYLMVLSANGRYLSFTDESTTTAQRFGFDNVSARCPGQFSDDPGPCIEVYVYDADANGGTGQLACASCRTDGARPLGHSGDPDVSSVGQSDLGSNRLNAHQAQTVADDGTVFFTTPDNLVAADGNGANDVYAYKAGEVRLISRATQGAKARFLDATPDGKTVFLATADAIVGTDTDNAVDVYMTRADAGYPYTAPPVARLCTESDCRGPLPPAPIGSPVGSVSFFGPGNAMVQTASRGKKVTVAKVKAIRGFTGSLKVTAPGKGLLTVSGSGVRRVARSVSRAGTSTVSVALTTTARKTLRKTRSVTKKVRVTFTPSDGKSQSTTLSVTFRSPAATKGGR
jgi:hypothetical protein